MHANLGNMAHRLLGILIGLICSLGMSAHVITLQTGEKKQGEIVFQNEEVVIFKEANGSRYQYPLSDVASISEDATQVTASVETKTKGSKRIGVMLQATEGAYLFNQAAYEHLGADLCIGACNVADRHIFLGGGIGYHALISKAIGIYAFMPIQVRAEIPFMQGKNAPFAGIGAGYGIGLSKSYRGGIHAGLDLGWRHQLNSGRAILLSANASVQGCRFNQATSLIGQQSYTDKDARRSLFSAGVKFAISL